MKIDGVFFLNNSELELQLEKMLCLSDIWGAIVKVFS